MKTMVCLPDINASSRYDNQAWDSMSGDGTDSAVNDCPYDAAHIATNTQGVSPMVLYHRYGVGMTLQLLQAMGVRMMILALGQLIIMPLIIHFMMMVCLPISISSSIYDSVSFEVIAGDVCDYADTQYDLSCDAIGPGSIKGVSSNNNTSSRYNDTPSWGFVSVNGDGCAVDDIPHVASQESATYPVGVSSK